MASLFVTNHLHRFISDEFGLHQKLPEGRFGKADAVFDVLIELLFAFSFRAGIPANKRSIQMKFSSVFEAIFKRNQHT